MNHAEIISLGDTLDVCINEGLKTKFMVSLCDNGRIKLIAHHIGREHDVYSIDLFIKEEKQEKA